jgi:hypothetical protein
MYNEIKTQQRFYKKTSSEILQYVATQIYIL